MNNISIHTKSVSFRDIVLRVWEDVKGVYTENV